jgi:hypothetical protein
MATLDIELYYDLDRRRWTTSAGGLAAQPSLFIGQSNTIDFKVRFVQGGVPIELTNPSFIAGLKVTDDPLGDYLLLTTTGTKTGTGATTIYTFTLLIDSVELQAYLVGITPSTNSTAFEVRDTVNNIATLPAITCSILPDYTLTGATPAAGSGTLVVDSGATFTVHKTFAMPTTDGTDTYILQTNGAGVGSWVAKPSGGVTSVAQSFTGGIVSVGGSPVTTSGTLALTVAGTQGGIVYFTSGTGWGSTGSLSLGGLVLGGGTGIPTVLSAALSGSVLTSQGVNTSPAYSSTITLGASGTLGTITLGNATSGTILITPPTGALGTPTLTLPITSTTLAGLSVAQTFNAAQTFSSTVSLTLDTDATSSTAGGTLTVTGGAAVSKKLFIGTLLDLVATTSTAGQITQAGTRILHTSGTVNLFLGEASGNTALVSTGSTNNGSNNIGIGKNSLLAVTTGTGNTAIGRVTLTALTTGANNVALGDGTGASITDGEYNILVGRSSGQSITTGDYNSAIGGLALTTCSAGGSNVAIGFQSLGSTNASNNTAVGFNSGYYSTGNNGTYIGQSAGIATASVGGLAGVAITTGVNNTMIGQASSSTLATGTYRTAIGSDSRCESNNAIKLGRDTLDVVLLPKMTQAQMATAATTLSTVKGALVYCTDGGADADHVHFYNGTSWARLN